MHNILMCGFDFVVVLGRQRGALLVFAKYALHIVISHCAGKMATCIQKQKSYA